MDNQKKIVGVVVSDSVAKTRIMKTSRRFRVPKYEKTVNMTDRYMFHDEENLSKNGDTVEVVFSRPLSKRKRWTLSKIVEKRRELA